MIYEFRTAPEGTICDDCFFTLIRYASIRVIQRAGDKSPGIVAEAGKAGELAWGMKDLCLECFGQFIGRWLELAVPDKGKTQVFKYQYVFPSGYQRIVVEEDE